MAVAGAAALAVAALVVWWQVGHLAGPATPGTMAGAARVGGAFNLTDQAGRTVTDQTYRGRLMLVYFGFTFCPDVCPTDLQVMAQALDLLGPSSAEVQPLFVTVDPERDTPGRMAEYVGLFDERIGGLTGTPEQIAEIAKGYKVYYRKAKGSDPESYTMDHSAFIYLMGRDGAFLEVFPHGTTPERLAEAVRKHL
ncbi:SCO family protein [Arenibaculum pallidiluteum]|uniref:SCO family protein n=1 Tax=Arenibaculum pallidiluteum TaxID=2812559 RepID=UPI001F195619|nr:SCO family protein [Arenibaculum pallidiluteum]